jgi:hypothetical protein
MPVKLKISFSSGADTIVKVMNDVNNQLYTFNFTRQPTAVVFDPDYDIVLKVANTIGVKEISSVLPGKFELYQNYPNPFNPSTIIRFKIEDLRFTTLKVYDILGKEIASLVNEKLKAGTYEVTLDGGNLSSGIYFYKLTAGNYIETKRMILMK